jgi:hypothetical protein
MHIKHSSQQIKSIKSSAKISKRPRKAQGELLNYIYGKNVATIKRMIAASQEEDLYEDNGSPYEGLGSDYERVNNFYHNNQDTKDFDEYMAILAV